MKKIYLSPSYLALVYFIFSVLWILGSDWLVSFLFYQSPHLLIMAQQYKGLVFVLVTTVLIYVLLRSWKMQLNAYINASPAILYVLKKTDQGFIPKYVSGNVKNLLGFSVNQSLHKDWWQSQIHPEDRSKALKTFDGIEAHSHLTHEYRVYDAQGHIRYIRDEMQVSCDHKGRVIEVIGTWNDISTEKEQIQELNQAKVVFDATQEGIMIMDKQCQILNVNKAFTDITGYHLSEVEGRDPNFLKYDQEGSEYYHNIWDSIRANGYWQGEVYNRRKNGEIYPEILTINRVVDSENSVLNYVAIFSDLSQMKASQKKLNFLTDYDVITRLPNRFSMVRKLQQQILLSQKTGESFALFLLDLDYFKNINDSYGHSTGDALLKKLSQKLSEYLDKNDSLSRLGGDEFAFWLSPLDKKIEAEQLAIEVLNLINQTWILDDTHLELSASIGVCVFPKDGTTSESLLQNADAALYHAKS
ncbi:diguanylate cyclase [Hydrogenovibrio sp. 3SP14C1]|uniref:sensor domain-containing diguanylate cyclase n=1 Tax=Hydrogenovibrio sp. 3SP14C1 TaxID=3038774 RepID=UPI0024177C40|nr:sensor domain-containing diguanylate cyclase [Hydrogenovibrio sp. 3SP14C1]MDG4812465.1 diguanylate cyclase [Hydrogenovibrio sp. 3SP14C1]